MHILHAEKNLLPIIPKTITVLNPHYGLNRGDMFCNFTQLLQEKLEEKKALLKFSKFINCKHPSTEPHEVAEDTFFKAQFAPCTM